MKKTLCVWMLLACILLTSCVEEISTATSGNGVNQGNSALDAENKYLKWSRIFPIIESENAFYGLLGGRAHYYDRQSGFSDFLCANPSCEHNSESCGSYLENMSELFGYYDGKLYWLAQSDPETYNSRCLYRCSPDGNNREKVMELDFQRIIIGYNPQQWVLHRGRLFFMGEASIVMDTQAGYRVTLGYIPLDGSGEPILLFDEKLSRNVLNAEMRMVGDRAYYLLDVDRGGAKIMEYDIQHNTSEILWETEDESVTPWCIWITEQYEVYAAVNGTVYQVMDGRLEPAVSFGAQDCPTLGKNAMINVVVEEGIRMADIRTYDGTVLYQGELFPRAVAGLEDVEIVSRAGLAVAGLDQEKLIVILNDVGMCYCIMLDIARGMEATLLWSGKLV